MPVTSAVPSPASTAQSGGRPGRRVQLADERRAGLPEHEAEQGAGDREHRRFGQKGVADRRAGGAERLEQADFGRALGDRDEHHVHHQDAGDGQADRRDAGDGEGHRAEQAVEGGEDGVLGDDRHVLFALVAQLDDLGTCALAGSMASRLLASTRMRNRVLLLNIACASATGTMTSSSVFIPSPWPVEARTPTMRKRRSPTRTSWPSASSWPNISSRILGADDRFGRAAPPVAGRQEAPLRERQAAHVDEVGGGAGDHDFAQLAADADLRGADGERRDPVHGAGARSACASSIVRSRGVLVIALPGLKPPVCERPGRTITRLLPIDENWLST
jgi:hypothetical protein